MQRTVRLHEIGLQKHLKQVPASKTRPSAAQVMRHLMRYKRQFEDKIDNFLLHLLMWTHGNKGFQKKEHVPSHSFDCVIDRQNVHSTSVAHIRRRGNAKNSAIVFASFSDFCSQFTTLHPESYKIGSINCQLKVSKTTHWHGLNAPLCSTNKLAFCSRIVSTVEWKNAQFYRLLIPRFFKLGVKKCSYSIKPIISQPILTAHAGVD